MYLLLELHNYTFPNVYSAFLSLYLLVRGTRRLCVYPPLVVLCVFSCAVVTMWVPWLSFSIPWNSTHARMRVRMHARTCTVDLWKLSSYITVFKDTGALVFQTFLLECRLAFVDDQAHMKSRSWVVSCTIRVHFHVWVQFVTLMFVAVTGVTVCVAECLADAPLADAWQAGWVVGLDMIHANTNALACDFSPCRDRGEADTMDQPWSICPFVLLCSYINHQCWAVTQSQ